MPWWLWFPLGFIVGALVGGFFILCYLGSAIMRGF